MQFVHFSLEPCSSGASGQLKWQPTDGTPFTFDLPGYKRICPMLQMRRLRS
ncbi:hypothetical protein L1280_000535 [Deinococcus sp. HSC-46F16]|uniref:hypothetical protein n=1 Tax=Deinococcus sp. HSC-46F16 TaxID=2910968 RepID=UPI00209EBA0C|nr:hypothetical protein [Deinococcus sp. HSC-46F16]MCP2013407.1 hypothetical protein [Deinococcus sp. HSC-46F16]